MVSKFQQTATTRLALLSLRLWHEKDLPKIFPNRPNPDPMRSAKGQRHNLGPTIEDLIAMDYPSAPQHF